MFEVFFFYLMTSVSLTLSACIWIAFIRDQIKAIEGRMQSTMILTWGGAWPHVSVWALLCKPKSNMGVFVWDGKLSSDECSITSFKLSGYFI